MRDARAFMVKINEIEKRMDYVVDSWESDSQITSQEIRFVLSVYIHGLYQNKKVKKLAKAYVQKIKERRRLDSETISTAIASALIINKDFSEYWNKLKERIERSSTTEKLNLIIQLLVILTPNTLKKIDDIEYIRELLNCLKKQDTEKKLIYHWACEHLFSEERKIDIDPDTIKNLKEYLLWELITSKEYENQNESLLRKKYVPEILDYKIERIDWIVFLLYQFLKKNELYVITESELSRKINKEVRQRINKKVWFPVVFSMLFLLTKLWIENIAITWQTVGQISMIILGSISLFFEEKLPSFEIPVKRYKITFGQIGEFLIILSILWTLGLISLITEVIP